MHVLVAVASRHGSTREIAVEIAQELRAAGLEVTAHNVAAVSNLDRYDAVVLGSAVYLGSWMAEARHWVEQHQMELVTMPVWLFTSGPVGSGSQPDTEPRELVELLHQSGAREHHVFAGKLDRAELNPGERLVTRIVHAPEGDFRDWEAVRAWAREIAAALVALPIA